MEHLDAKRTSNEVKAICIIGAECMSSILLENKIAEFYSRNGHNVFILNNNKNEFNINQPSVNYYLLYQEKTVKDDKIFSRAKIYIHINNHKVEKEQNEHHLYLSVTDQAVSDIFNIVISYLKKISF